jgi:predicted Rossmann fold flavoprotein
MIYFTAFLYEMKQQLTVIGGGAAGFFCAVNAARLNPLLKVVIVEKSSKLLAKVKVSGGGRCNVTHACFDIAEMSRKYPRGQNFVKKTFHQFFTTDTIEWFKERSVTLITESDGRMFPSTNSAATITDCLLREANKYGVEIIMNREVVAVQKEEAQFKLLFNNNHSIVTDYVCVAAGGYPKVTMFNWLLQLGHNIEAPLPSLFTFNLPSNAITQLMGVSVEQATVKIVSTKLAETAPLLITHWGLSGPTVLKLSAWGARELAAMSYEFNIVVNWLPAIKEPELRSLLQQYRNELAHQKLGSKNQFSLPARLWDFILKHCGIDTNIRWADLSATSLNKLVQILNQHSFKVSGKTTFKEEFVTAGGIQLNEVEPHTMMSKLQQGLFFAGEILNVDGITGGFNFQNAWTTGWIAAKTIADLSVTAV